MFVIVHVAEVPASRKTSPLRLQFAADHGAVVAQVGVAGGGLVDVVQARAELDRARRSAATNVALGGGAVDSQVKVPESSGGTQSLSTVRVAGCGGRWVFVIVQVAESPALTVIDPSAAQSPPITLV